MMCEKVEGRQNNVKWKNEERKNESTESSQIWSLKYSYDELLESDAIKWNAELEVNQTNSKTYTRSP